MASSLDLKDKGGEEQKKQMLLQVGSVRRQWQPATIFIQGGLRNTLQIASPKSRELSRVPATTPFTYIA